MCFCPFLELMLLFLPILLITMKYSSSFSYSISSRSSPPCPWPLLPGTIPLLSIPWRALIERSFISPKTWRLLFFVPYPFSFSLTCRFLYMYENDVSIKLSFILGIESFCFFQSLGGGCYATMLLREITHLGTDKYSQLMYEQSFSASESKDMNN